MNEYTVKFFDDRTEWFKDGALHRENGPAIEYTDGTNFWYLNGEQHREDGPAVERSNGYKAWYLNGTKYTEEAFNLQTNQKSKRNMKPTESDLKQMIEKTIADFDFEEVQRCVHTLAPRFGTTSTIEEMKASARRIFKDCLMLVTEYGMPVGRIARDGYEATVNVTESAGDGLCRLAFVPVESEVWHCDIDQENKHVNLALDRIDQFERQVLAMIEELRQAISQPK